MAAYRPITYARRGYGHSDHPPGQTTIQEQASDCRGLLSALRIERAHVVGHSYGGTIALQLAMDAPEAVHSLTLLEPALLVGASARGYLDSLTATVRRGKEAGASVAVHEFLELRSPGYRERLEELVPGAFSQAVKDAATTIENELPGLPDWHFEKADARRIASPTLAVVGEKSKQLSPRFEEAYRLLLDWLPSVEGAEIKGATHLMQFDNPLGLAETIAYFLSKHPM
jgi:pimeloyl-ACP methyl ester carboxylesterase